MSAYGVVIGFLLLFPWGLVGVIVVGAAIDTVKRRLESTRPSGASTLDGCLCVGALPHQRSQR